MSDSYQEFHAKLMEDPGFRAEWEAMEPDREIAYAIAASLSMRKLTEKQLAKATGIKLSELRKLELMENDSILGALKRLAAGMDMKLKLEFEPIESR